MRQRWIWCALVVFGCTSEEPEVPKDRDAGADMARDAGSGAVRDGGVSVTRDGGDTTGRDGGDTTGRDGGDTTGRDGGDTMGRDGGDTVGRDGGDKIGRDGGDVGRDGGDVTPDGGGTDAGSVDAGTADAGTPDAGVVYTLTAATTSTGGAVYSTPGAIACTLPPSGSCAETYAPGTSVTLTASAATDFAFDRWTGDCSGGPTATVFMDRDRSCTANFIGTAGQISLVPPPLSVIPNVTEDPQNILIFRERTDYVLPAGIPMDIHVPDTYQGGLPGTPGTLPAGLVVNVYYVHFDPVGTGGFTNRVASLLFGEPIVAMVAVSSTLDATDTLLGLTSTVTYPAPGTHPVRGLELDGSDIITLRPDRRHVDIDFTTTTSSDQFRIITLSVPGAQIPFLTNGAFAAITPPASVTLNATQSSSVAYGFRERSVTLSAPLDVEIASPGVYLNAGSIATASVSAGTQVTSYFVHFDPVAGTPTIRPSVTFDQTILGFIILNAGLGATDATLGRPGVTYVPVDPNRQIELGNGDWIRFSGDLRSFRAQLRASNGTDQMRVILGN